MKQKILYKAKTQYGHWVKGNIEVDAFDNYTIKSYERRGNAQHYDCYSVIPETVERLVHEENDVKYFTGDKLAVYSDLYPTFEEALAEDEACISEIDDNGLVILENEERLIPISDLSYCHKFYHLTTEEYKKYEKIIESRKDTDSNLNR